MSPQDSETKRASLDAGADLRHLAVLEERDPARKLCGRLWGLGVNAVPAASEELTKVGAHEISEWIIDVAES